MTQRRNDKKIILFLFFFCFLLSIFSLVAKAETSSESSDEKQTKIPIVQDVVEKTVGDVAVPVVQSAVSDVAVPLVGEAVDKASDVARLANPKGILDLTYPALHTITLVPTLVTSRIPGFFNPLDEASSNVTGINYDTDSDFSFHPRTFQEEIKKIDSAVLYDQVGNGLDTTFSLRGFNEGSAVIFLMDGVRVNELDGDVVTYPLIVMDDVYSITVERGSVSPVYGSNAFAGVVNITTGQPSDKPVHVFGGLELSSPKGIRFNQGVSGTIQDQWTPLNGKFKYYFNAGRNGGNGFRDNGEYRINSFDIKAYYEVPEAGAEFRVLIKHIEDRVQNPGELTFNQFEAGEDGSNKPLDHRKYNNTIFQMNFDKTFWDEKLKFSTQVSWRRNIIDSLLTTGTFADFVTGSSPDTDLVKTISKSTNFIGQLGYKDEWDWIENESLLGVEVTDGVEHAMEIEAPGGVVDNSVIETDRTSEPFNASLFWREQMTFFKKLIMHVGMRHDRYHLKANDTINTATTLNQRWVNSTVSAGAVFKPVTFMDLFFNYSQGFRVPTISEMAGFASTINLDLEPEESESYEVGARLRFWEKKAAMRFSYFLIDLENEILFDSTAVTASTPFGRNVNVGESRRHGIELGIDTKPIDELQLEASYTLTQAYVRKNDGGGVVVKGRDIGQVPQHRIVIGGHVFPFKKLGEPLDGFRASILGIYTGDQRPQGFESASAGTLGVGQSASLIKSFWVWDFIISQSWKNKEVYFKINNLFDRRYYSRAVTAFSDGSGIYPTGNFTFVNPGAPREFVLGFKWAFD